MWKFIKRIFSLDISPDEMYRIEQIKRKQDNLAKYGGRMVVRNRRLMIVFDTKEGEREYWQSVRDKFWNRGFD